MPEIRLCTFGRIPISIIALLIMISFVPSVPFHHDTDNSLLEQKNYHAYTSGNKIYLYNNLTMNQTDELIGIDHELCFPGNGSYFIFLNSNIELSHETIFSARGNITIMNGKHSDRDKFNSVHLNMNGTLYLSNATVCFMNSTLGNKDSRLSMCFHGDNVTSYGTVLNGTKQLTPSTYVTSSASNGAQPISAIECCQLTFTKNRYFKYPITSLCECLNYQMSGSPVNVYTNFTLDKKNFTLVDHVNEENKLSRLTINLTTPVYVTDKSNNIIYANFSFPYATKLTIWNYTLSMISNSSMNFTGFIHNYIMLNHTSLVALNSTFNGNSGQFMSGGILNMKKTGMMLNNGSTATFIDSNFYNTTGVSNPPIIIRGESTFYYIPIMRIMYSSLGSDHFLHRQGITGNNSIDTTLEGLLGHNLTMFNLLNYSYLLGAYELGNDGILQNVFQYSIYNYSSYASIPTASLLHTKCLYVVKIFHNVSSVSFSPFSILRTNKTITYSFNVSYNIFTRTSVRLNISQNAYGIENLSKHEYTLQDEHSFIHFNRTIAYTHECGNLFINISLKYYNGFRQVTKWNNNTFLLPEMNYSYRISAIDLPSNLQFIVDESNETIGSINQSVLFNSSHNNLTAHITGSGYYVPTLSTLTVHSGTTYISFHKKIATLHVYTQGISSPNITVNGVKEGTGDSEKFNLLYGNYTLTINSRQGVISVNILINSPDIYISVSSHTAVNFTEELQEFTPILMSSFIVAALYNYARTKYWRICRVCMIPVRLGERHVHRKKVN